MSKIAYLFGPVPNETPGDYILRLTDKIYDVDEVTRCQPVFTDAPIPSEWRNKIQWVRYEQELWQRCCDLRESLWDVIADLLIQGRHGHDTRPRIEEAIRLETAVSGRPVDEFELIDFVTMLKGF
jgi:hypothetical protein